jgi:hypothetical protein
MHLVVDNSKRLGHAGIGKKIILADEVACKKSVKVQGDEKRTHEKTNQTLDSFQTVSFLKDIKKDVSSTWSSILAR